MANVNSGILAPPGVELKESDTWFDGNVLVRPGGTFTNNASTGSIAAPLTATPATPASGNATFTNSAGQLSSVSATGLVAIIGGVTQATSATTTVANTASATALQSYTVPANDPIAGAVYTMTGYGVYSDTGTPTLTFTLYWGGVAGTSLTAVPAITLGSGVTNVPYSYTVTVNFRSATSAVATINLSLGTSAATDAASSFVAVSASPVAVTSTSANALTLGVTWSAASASNTISLLGGFVERIA